MDYQYIIEHFELSVTVDDRSVKRCSHVLTVDPDEVIHHRKMMEIFEFQQI